MGWTGSLRALRVFMFKHYLAFTRRARSRQIESWIKQYPAGSRCWIPHLPSLGGADDIPFFAASGNLIARGITTPKADRGRIGSRCGFRDPLRHMKAK